MKGEYDLFIQNFIMDFLDLVKNRYSCRSFSNKEIEPGKINKILEAGKASPTACNLQPQRILVLTEKEKLNRLSEGTRFGWSAPLVMIICFDKNISWKRKYDGHDEGYTDASIVTTHMMLEIFNLGLGTTWVGSFNPEKIREVYNIPENFEIVSILPIGYPADDSAPSNMHFQREELDKTVFYNNF